MSRHHVNNIFLTWNFHFASDFRHWIHPLMLLLHCLWATSNYRTRGQFECDMFCFCFDFVHSHSRWGCCSIVCLRFQDVQIKQVDCKVNTKIVNNYKWKSFCDIFGQLHIQEYKATKKADSEASDQPWPQHIISL